MAPKARGRHTDEQIRRETEGLKWKSASTLDRQRKRKKHRQNKMRARTPTREEAAPRTKARPPPPPPGPRTGGRGQEPQVEEDVLDDEATSEASLSEPGPSAPSRILPLQPSQPRGQPSQLRAGPEAAATEAVGASPSGLRPVLTAAPPPRGQPSQLRAGPEAAATEAVGASPSGLRPLLTAAPPRTSEPPGLALEVRSRPEALPIDSSPTSSNVEEVTLTGEELRSWPTLPHTVAFQGVHRGPDPPGDVIANFFPDTLQLLRDFSSGEKLTTPLELRRLTAGKSRAVYDFQPTRQYLLKLSVPGPGQAVPGYHSPGRGYPGGGHPGLRGQNLASERSWSLQPCRAGAF